MRVELDGIVYKRARYTGDCDAMFRVRVSGVLGMTMPVLRISMFLQPASPEPREFVLVTMMGM
ncbi:predicted protein [Plenodomus lingam JN3]|uniref:Uncharacterized protein n=1 Tax=Leptosphaeria maculans (strain JN3 / isolate v23.1.3 / race Av1-4-5-6-7-8) TaxID=985895 RepID=E5A689_LEPMJ|nr:predicted protein [Plenodomus lingam JN3]CBX99134.1 predicted protein [Plenodomus lingam JN3]